MVGGHILTLIIIGFEFTRYVWDICPNHEFIAPKILTPLTKLWFQKAKGLIIPEGCGAYFGQFF